LKGIIKEWPAKSNMQTSSQPGGKCSPKIVLVLIEKGTSLHRPLVDTIKGSLFPNMKELRVQHAGRPLSIFFAFDPLRRAILLIGGDKTGNKRFYEIFVPRADAIYSEYLEELAGKRTQT
jgi:hypothetical protein